MLKHILLLTILSSIQCTSKDVVFQTLGGNEIARGTLQDYERIKPEVEQYNNAALPYKGPAWTQIISMCQECNEKGVKYNLIPDINPDGPLMVTVMKSAIDLIETDIYVNQAYNKFKCYPGGFPVDFLKNWPAAEGDTITLTRGDLPEILANTIERDELGKYINTVKIRRKSNGDFYLHDFKWSTNKIDGKDVECVIGNERECKDVWIIGNKIHLNGNSSFIKLDMNSPMPKWMGNIRKALQDSVIATIIGGNGLIRKDVLKSLLEQIPEKLEYRLQLISPVEIAVVWNNLDGTQRYITVELIMGDTFVPRGTNAKLIPILPDLKTFLTQIIMQYSSVSTFIKIISEPAPLPNAIEVCLGGVCKLLFG